MEPSFYFVRDSRFSELPRPHPPPPTPLPISVGCSQACADPEGGQGFQTPPPSLKNHKNIGFLSSTGPDPLKFSKSQSYQAIKSRFAGGPMLAHFKWYLDPLSSKKNKHRQCCIVGPPLTKLSGSAHEKIQYIDNPMQN